MNPWESARKRPRTMNDWKEFVDGMSRHQRDQLYPGMHKDLIPATEMIEAGWMGTSNHQTLDPLENNDQTPLVSDDPDYQAIADSAAGELMAGSHNFFALAEAMQGGQDVDMAEVTRLRKLGVKGPEAIATLAGTCSEAARALGRSLKFVRGGQCDGAHPTACAQLNGSTIRVTDLFEGLHPRRKVSVFGHEGVHLAGYDHSFGPTDPETVEAAVFHDAAKPWKAP